MSKPNRNAISKRPALRALKQVFQTLDSIENSTSRFANYQYLREIYAVHHTWTTENVLDKRIAELKSATRLNDRTGAHPIRVLIDATHPSADRKTASLWTRVLLFAIGSNVEPKRLIKFIRERKGIAGCAKRAAMGNRLPNRDDWIEEFEWPLRESRAREARLANIAGSPNALGHAPQPSRTHRSKCM